MLVAANLSKKELLWCVPSIFTRSQPLVTIPRAFWDRNIGVASLLWARTALARQQLGSLRVD
eukprot:4802735-Karenia_brevis.AAC.1